MLAAVFGLLAMIGLVGWVKWRRSRSAGQGHVQPIRDEEYERPNPHDNHHHEYDAMELRVRRDGNQPMSDEVQERTTPTQGEDHEYDYIDVDNRRDSSQDYSDAYVGPSLWTPP